MDLERELKFVLGRAFDDYKKQVLFVFDNATIHTTFELKHFF